MSQTISEGPPASEAMSRTTKARVCQEPECDTVLSRYNTTKWCSMHTRRDWRASRGPRSAPSA